MTKTARCNSVLSTHTSCDITATASTHTIRCVFFFFPLPAIWMDECLLFQGNGNTSPCISTINLICVYTKTGSWRSHVARYCAAHFFYPLLSRRLLPTRNKKTRAWNLPTPAAHRSSQKDPKKKFPNPGSTACSAPCTAAVRPSSATPKVATLPAPLGRRSALAASDLVSNQHGNSTPAKP